MLCGRVVGAHDYQYSVRRTRVHFVGIERGKPFRSIRQHQWLYGELGDVSQNPKAMLCSKNSVKEA